MSKFNFNEQIVPEQLTKILEKAGHLSNGEVSSVELVHSRSEIQSTVTRLKIKYSHMDKNYLPERFLLKTVNPDFYETTEKEVDFYNLASKSKLQLPLASCYGAEKNYEEKQYFILLEDLSDTHFQSKWPLPPQQEQCTDAIAAIASVHAYWWNHPDLRKPPFSIPSESWVRDWIKYAEIQYSKFVDFLGDRLSAKRKKTYELVLRELYRIMLSSLSSSKQLTLIHGDSHLHNYLYPRDRKRHPCIIIDWQSWLVGIGAFDLAYMIALHWFPERRQRMELPMLKLYLEEIHKHGINYTWDELWKDYRVSVLVTLIFPILQHSEVPTDTWWNHLERSFSAFEDLNCLELL